MADVIAMDSDMTRDTGSTATETGRLLYCMRDESERPGLLCRGSTSGVPGTEESAESIVATTSWSSRLILQRPGSGCVDAAGVVV